MGHFCSNVQRVRQQNFIMKFLLIIAILVIFCTFVPIESKTTLKKMEKEVKKLKKQLNKVALKKDLEDDLKNVATKKDLKKKADKTALDQTKNQINKNKIDIGEIKNDVDYNMDNIDDIWYEMYHIKKDLDEIKDMSTNTTGQQGGCAQIPSWMKTAIQQKAAERGLGRIIQGQTAPEPIPWQAHMRQVSPNGGFFYFCGGTILDAKTILTAAHCYYGADLTAGNFFIAAGAVHVLDASAQTAFVESIILHESYNPGEPGSDDYNLNNDIAILKLKTPLTFNDKVGPACLPDASFNPEGIAVASGWGLTGQFPDVETSDLQYVAKPVIVRDECINTLWGPGLTAGMICAGDADGGESTCSGDSGGPLIVPKNSTDDTAVVIGVTSFGLIDGCGSNPGFPAVYAYVTNYLDWILPKMEK